jgi:hypothetical protein
MIASLSQEHSPHFSNLLSKPFIILSIMLNGLFPLAVWGNNVEITRVNTFNGQTNLRVQVVNDEKIPIQGLKSQDFQVETTDKQGKSISLSPSKIQLISPEETSSDPTYLIVLLDMSGSMKQKDLAGTVKLKGATESLKNFLLQIQQDNLPVKIALVPFGEGCSHSYPVNNTVIENKFESTPYKNTNNDLDKLAKIEVCSATNIYEPLGEAIKYLGAPNRFQASGNEISDPNFVPPRLGIILFSDGFDVYRSNESQRFQNLLALMKQYPEITIHTMGYGERLYQLRDRAKCAVSNDRLTVDVVREICKLPQGDIKEFIVDEPRLKEIADKTGGIHRFPGNPTDVINSLKTFLTTLREYEIRFQQPGADRASKHTAMIKIISNSKNLPPITSNKKGYRMDNFIYKSPPTWQRFGIFLGTLALGVGGWFGFRKWSKDLTEKSQRFLS